MSELLTQWSGILAYLGDEGSQDGFQNTNYSDTPKLTDEQLKKVNVKLLTLMESLDKYKDEKDELLEMMRDYDPETTGMQGGKRRRRKKTRKNRRA
jgi:hypothetical protein